MGLVIKFEENNNDTLILDNSFYKEFLEYADSHNLNVLYTNTTSTISVEAMMEFQKRGYSHELYEIKQFAPDGIELSPKVYCRFIR